MFSFINHFGSSSSALGTLGFSAQAFFIQLITFLLAYWVLKRWAFGPIVKVLNQRRQTIEDGIKLGDKMQHAQAELEAQIAKQLHATRRQADAILAESQAVARQNIHQAEDKARAEAKSILKIADTRIAQDAARVRRQLESEVIDLVADTTQVIIEEKIDSKKDTVLIKQALRRRQAP